MSNSRHSLPWRFPAGSASIDQADQLRRRHSHLRLGRLSDPGHKLGRDPLHQPLRTLRHSRPRHRLHLHVRCPTAIVVINLERVTDVARKPQQISVTRTEKTLWPVPNALAASVF